MLFLCFSRLIMRAMHWYAVMFERQRGQDRGGIQMKKIAKKNPTSKIPSDPSKLHTVGRKVCALFFLPISPHILRAKLLRHLPKI